MLHRLKEDPFHNLRRLGIDSKRYSIAKRPLRHAKDENNMIKVETKGCHLDVLLLAEIPLNREETFPPSLTDLNKDFLQKILLLLLSHPR